MKRKLLKLTFLLALFLTPSLGLCLTKVPLMIIHPRGPNDFNLGQIYEMYFAVKERYRALGYDLKLKRYRSPLHSPYIQQGNSFLDYTAAMIHWQYWLVKQRLVRKHWIFLVAAPPAPADGVWWFGGVARQTCSRNPRIAYTTLGPVSAHGPSRVLHSWTVVEHEIGHLLGASHLDAYDNVMHSAALHLIKGSLLPWDPLSAAQMQSCSLYRNFLAGDPNGF